MNTHLTQNHPAISEAMALLAMSHDPAARIAYGVLADLPMAPAPAVAIKAPRKSRKPAALKSLWYRPPSWGRCAPQSGIDHMRREYGRWFAGRELGGLPEGAGIQVYDVVPNRATYLSAADRDAATLVERGWYVYAADSNGNRLGTFKLPDWFGEPCEKYAAVTIATVREPVRYASAAE